MFWVWLLAVFQVFEYLHMLAHNEMSWGCVMAWMLVFISLKAPVVKAWSHSGTVGTGWRLDLVTVFRGGPIGAP